MRRPKFITKNRTFPAVIVRTDNTQETIGFEGRSTWIVELDLGHTGKFRDGSCVSIRVQGESGEL